MRVFFGFGGWGGGAFLCPGQVVMHTIPELGRQMCFPSLPLTEHAPCSHLQASDCIAVFNSPQPTKLGYQG